MYDFEYLIEICEERGDFKSLENVQSEIPSGKCSGCSKCCNESVSTSLVEFLHILKHMIVADKLDDYFENKVYEYNLMELVEHQSCIFLDFKGMCSIYHVRPLVCRLFGHQSKEEQERKNEIVNRNNKEVANTLFENYGLMIPKEVVDFKIDYCVDFKIESKMSESERENMYRNMMDIDKYYYFSDEIDENDINLTLVDWFNLYFFDVEELGKIKIDFLKDKLK